MVDLSSCYFCTRAVDVPLQEYTIGPQSGESRTVILCRPCRQKLDPLLEPFRETTAQSPSATRTDPGGIVTDEPEAVFTGSTADDTEQDTTSGDSSSEGDDSAAESGTAGGDSSSGSQPSAAAGPTPDERESTTESQHSTEQTTDGRSTAEGTVGTTRAASDETLGVADDPRSTQESVADDNEPAATSSTDNPLVTDADDQVSDGSELGTDDGVTIQSSDEEDTAQPTDSTGQQAADSTESHTGTSADDTADNPLSNVSTSTYNRVIRLLQNREFPVVRDEFEELASNAYQMDRTDCSTALDAAIHKELLIEENGLLKRPE